MNKLCVTNKCRYCEAMFVNGELRYRCTAQPYSPWIYPNISACPHEIPHREREKNMELEPMTLEELLEMLKSGRVGNINDYYMGMFIRYLEELQVYKKALELACDEIRARDCSAFSYTNFDCGVFREAYEACVRNIEFENYYLKKARSAE